MRKNYKYLQSSLRRVGVLFITVFLSTFTIAQNNTEWQTQGNIVDSNAFIGTTNASCLRFRSNNLERMRINELGNIGIGIVDPKRSLDVEGDIQLTGDLIFRGYADNQDTSQRILTVNKDGITNVQKLSFFQDISYIGDCYQKLYSFDGGYTFVPTTMASWSNTIQGSKSVLYTGKTCPAWVGVGTDNPNTKLEVIGNGHFSKSLYVGTLDLAQNTGLYIENKSMGSNQNQFENLILVKNANGNKILQLEDNGLLRTREIITDTEAWPDYVFEEDYNLKSLYEVKSFINQNGHLPNVPSANELGENGINLGEMAKITMEKVEELTLYLIKQQELLDEQQKLIDKQQQQIDALLKH